MTTEKGDTMKTIAVALLALFLLTSCATGQIQASGDCVQALAALGIEIAGNVGAGGTWDLSSVLAVILANGGDISAAVAACSGIFTAKTNSDLSTVVASKVKDIPKSTKEMRATVQKIPVPQPPVKVRLR